MEFARVLDEDPENGTSADLSFTCEEWMESCELAALPDGSRLGTFAEHATTVAGEVHERLVADRLVDQVRVVVAATNGSPRASGDAEVTRPDAVLSSDQLVAVVSQPWWGFNLPARFAGDSDVPSYTELPESATAGSTAFGPGY